MLHGCALVVYFIAVTFNLSSDPVASIFKRGPKSTSAADSSDFPLRQPDLLSLDCPLQTTIESNSMSKYQSLIMITRILEGQIDVDLACITEKENHATVPVQLRNSRGALTLIHDRTSG